MCNVHIVRNHSKVTQDECKGEVEQKLCSLPVRMHNHPLQHGNVDYTYRFISGRWGAGGGGGGGGGGREIVVKMEAPTLSYRSQCAHFYFSLAQSPVHNND